MTVGKNTGVKLNELRTILLFSDGYLPGYKYGGPIRALSNLVDSLGDEFIFRIITRDRDLGSRSPYSGISINEWQKVGKASVFYVSPDRLTMTYLYALIKEAEYDVLYFNSMFSPELTIKPLVLLRLGLISRKRVVLAPRGMLLPGALKIKAVKKRMFIMLARITGLYRGIVWQASSVLEHDAIKSVFEVPQSVSASLKSIAIASDVPASLSVESIKRSEPKSRGFLKVLFIARICPVKNLEGALTMLANIRGEVLFNIYGPLEDRSYWERCRLIIEGMPSNIHVYYRGEVRHEEVYAVLKAHDLFYLPTTGENFGHAIYESLSAGCPILISDRTPWRDVKGGGWSVPLEQPETFAAILQKCVDMNMEEWEVLSRNAFACAVERTVGQESIQQHRDIFACSNVTR